MLDIKDLRMESAQKANIMVNEMLEEEEEEIEYAI